MTNGEIATAITDMTLAERADYCGYAGEGARLIISTKGDAAGSGYNDSIPTLATEIAGRSAEDIDDINDLLSDVYIKHPCD